MTPHNLCTVIMTIIIYAQAVHAYAEISANLGAYFEEITYVHVYERTSTILYNIKLSMNTSLHEIRKKLTNTEDENKNFFPEIERERIDELMRNLYEMESMNKAIVAKFELKKQSTRRKRVSNLWGTPSHGVVM